jgi:acyl dehydratase
MIEVETPADMDALVGKPLGSSEWLTVTQEMIDLFAEATGDHQWIHVDRDRAAREINYGSNKVRFTQPVPAGARIRLHMTLKAAEPVDGGRRLITENMVEIEGEQRPALVAETISLVFG